MPYVGDYEREVEYEYLLGSICFEVTLFHS